MTTPSDREKLIEHIPDPQTVRERLGQALRETRLLRHLLRLAERVARERQHGKVVSRGR